MISNKPSMVNEFPPTLLSEIEARVNASLRRHRGPRIAAFDADGTLWDTDIGEAFFDYQIHNCHLPNMPADPWAHYHMLKEIEPTRAYVWLAQINSGQTLHQVRDWAKQSVQRLSPVPVFESQKKVMQLLRALDFEIYVVTASIKWAVEPAAELFGIDFDHVLGITTEVSNGLVTSTPVHPITWRQGKADGLLKATGGVRPLFCSGNTFGDIALLELATSAALAVSTQVEQNGLFEEEEKLRSEAKKNNWLQHHFRQGG